MDSRSRYSTGEASDGEYLKVAGVLAPADSSAMSSASSSQWLMDQSHSRQGPSRKDVSM